MFAVAEKQKTVTRALLVGAYWKEQTAAEARSLLDELAELADTLGLGVADRVLVKINAPQASYLIGSGKAQELCLQAEALECDVIVFDNELTPGQQRKWEELSGMAVIDREEVILDIFNGRARTKEARLQVELARMEYSLPRLARAWAHLSRQQGGGLGGLVSQFEQAGLGHVAQSWVGNGPNQSVSPQQLQSVFGQQQVQGMASQAGMAPNDFLSQLSQHLPNVVNSMTPNGRLPDEGTMSV